MLTLERNANEDGMITLDCYSGTFQVEIETKPDADGKHHITLITVHVCGRYVEYPPTTTNVHTLKHWRAHA